MRTPRTLALRAARLHRGFTSVVVECDCPSRWRVMLAARARGLGTTWTTLHLLCEEEAAQLLGVLSVEVNQAGWIPVAYTQGTHFRPVRRAPLETVVHWEAWEND